MGVKVRRFSRLRFGDLISIDGIDFWNFIDFPQLPDNPDDFQYQVMSGDRVDSLAQKFYGDPILWWVIALKNDLDILPTDLNDGDVLTIPSPAFVLSRMMRQARSR